MRGDQVEESKSTELLTRSGGNITVSTPAQTGQVQSPSSHATWTPMSGSDVAVVFCEQVGMLAMELGHMWGLQRWDEETGLSVLSQPLIAGAIVLDGQTDIRRDIDQGLRRLCPPALVVGYPCIRACVSHAWTRTCKGHAWILTWKRFACSSKLLLFQLPCQSC